MVTPFSPIQDQINQFFPPEGHPYRLLEQAVKSSIRPSFAVLDIGCGHGALSLRALSGQAAQLYGIDLIDFDALPQPGPDPGLSATPVTLIKEDVSELKSFADETIDLAYSRSVMEHVEPVERAYSEIHRVLKPGGQYIFLTPNRYDYASLIASLIPNRFHGRIVKATEGRDEIDTFPTFYRSNSFRAIRRLAASRGFRVRRLERRGQYPSYLAFSRPLYWLGCLYEKLIDKVPGLDVCKGWILCVLDKPANGSRGLD